MRITTKSIARAAIVAAMYIVLTLAFEPISYGVFQFRISEALTILPLFFIEAVPGLFIGCLVSNIVSGPWDILIGSSASLIAAILTYLLRKRFFVFGMLPPIIINALMVPIIFLTIPDITTGYWFNVGSVFIGQAAVILILGTALYFGLKQANKKAKLF